MSKKTYYIIRNHTKEDDIMKKKCSAFFSVCLMVAFLFGQSGLIGARAATPSSKGKLAIAEMKKMYNITWTSNTYPEVEIYGLKYKCGTRYKGMPYTQYWNARNKTYSEFLSDPAMVYAAPIYRYFLSQPKNPDGTKRELGNDCSAAVAAAWRAAGSGVSKSISTGSMYNAAISSTGCMKKRGSYGGSDTKTTRGWLTSSNYISVFSALKPGDVCFYHTKKSDGTHTGHAILITDVNTTSKTVSYIDQIGKQWRIDSAAHSTWTSGTKSFWSLYSDGYVPITTSDITI